jgi:hypothetical protein
MDIDEIDGALHEIEQMVEVAHRATKSLGGIGDNEIFQMPAADANLLDFSILDIAKRVKALRDAVCPVRMKSNVQT